MTTPSPPQTLTTTRLFDISGDPVLHATGPVSGAISLRYGRSDPPAQAWYLRVQFAPTIPDSATTDTAHIMTASINGTPVYGGSAHIWLSPGRRRPRTGTDLPDERPHDLRTDPWSPAPTSINATDTATLHNLYEVILTDWHTPERWAEAQRAHPQPATPQPDPGHNLAAVHTLATPSP
ncbi:hypothetical protein [Nocardia carnea]|uniref:hypothetical protein n=1 Tax=Nocardia carnea TaxID=37328 RepID=UPI0024547714|nr:hypothetical protein [Nocardia carnea]